MIVLDKLVDYNGESLKFNFYHKVHVSLIQKTKVWICFIPNNNNPTKLPELVISPIDFDAWEDLWRVSVTLEDRVGLVNDILECLKQNQLNIVSLETNSVGSQNLHQVELIVDARKYANAPYDKTTIERRDNLKISELKDLKRQILSRVIDNIYVIGGKPRIKTNRVYGLFHASQLFNQNLMNLPSNNDSSPRFSQTYVDNDEITDKDKLYPSRIILPDNIKKSINKAVIRSKEDLQLGNVKYLSVSDTKDRYLRVFFFHKEDNILCFTLRHREAIGALATITFSIKQAGFNILTSHSRVDRFGEKAITDFLIELPGVQSLEDQKLKDKLEQALSTKELVQFYELEVSYPATYNSKYRWRKLKMFSDSNALQDVQTTEVRLSLLFNEYQNIINNPEASEASKVKFNILQSLLVEENIKQPEKSNCSVFISYAFQDNEDLYNKVENIVKSHGFIPISGRDLALETTISDGLKLRIEHCDFFLGIWTKEKGIPIKGGKWYPSPWLFWEWGIAEGKDIDYRLVVSDEIGMNSLLKVLPNKPYLSFKYIDFEEKIHTALTYFEYQLKRKINR